MIDKFFHICNRLYQHAVYRLLGGTAYAKLIGVTIGEDCRIYTTNFGSEPFLISIGNKVTITAGVVFITHDGSTWLIRDGDGRRCKYSEIIIGNEVFVGVNSIVMPGVEIGNQVIVAAGSVVTKSIPTGVVVGGNPAKIIGSFKDYEHKVLTFYQKEKDMIGASYRDKVASIVSKGRKEELA